MESTLLLVNFKVSTGFCRLASSARFNRRASALTILGAADFAGGAAAGVDGSGGGRAWPRRLGGCHCHPRRERRADRGVEALAVRRAHRVERGRGGRRGGRLGGRRWTLKYALASAAGGDFGSL